MDTQMKKGILELCILHLVRKVPRYGYEIMKEVQEAFPDVYDGSVYAILRRLHADGCTETFMGSDSGGPTRKYYKLTDPGEQRYQEAFQEWKGILMAVAKLGI